MPRSPKKPCRFPGCAKLTSDRFCEEHRRDDYRSYNRYKRDPKTAERYGTEWRNIRNRYVMLHPLCEECAKQGKLTPTEEVHHIKPLAHGGTNDDENLMALCKSCHSRITVEMGDRWHDR